MNFLIAWALVSPFFLVLIGYGFGHKAGDKEMCVRAVKAGYGRWDCDPDGYRRFYFGCKECKYRIRTEWKI